MNPYLKQYRQTQIDTTPKEQILLMLYDGAVRFLHQAKAGFAEKDIEKIHNNLIKVQNIITEFEATLDMETGGEFAKNLYSLYEFMSRQLTIPNIRKDEAALEIVIKHMTELRDTWKEAVKQCKASGQSMLENEVDKYSTQRNNEETVEEDEEISTGKDIGEYI